VAILYQIPEKTLFMELFASLDHADAAKPIPAYTIHQSGIKDHPRMGEAIHLSLKGRR
jgi:hypothetical protein